MARRSILSAAERDALIACPNDDDLIIQFYTTLPLFSNIVVQKIAWVLQCNFVICGIRE
jgi:hypothetical protein